jgi:hypothetical protein
MVTGVKRIWPKVLFYLKTCYNKREHLFCTVVE